MNFYVHGDVYKLSIFSSFVSFLVINMWYCFPRGYSLFSHFGHPYCVFFLHVFAEKGMLPSYDQSGVISLDDLLLEKIGRQGVERNEKYKAYCNNIPAPQHGNPLQLDLLLLVCAFVLLLCACLYYLFSSRGTALFIFFYPFFADMGDFSTPAVAPPVIQVSSSTPRTRLRRGRVIYPSKFLLPPFTSVISSQHQNELYQKVIIHTRAEPKSKING